MLETSVILGNVFSLCAMVSDSVSGTRKKHSQIMGVQIISQFFYAASSIALKGYSSTAQNAVAVFRNLAAMKHIAVLLKGIALQFPDRRFVLHNINQHRPHTPDSISIPALCLILPVQSC